MICWGFPYGLDYLVNHVRDYLVGKAVAVGAFAASSLAEKEQMIGVVGAHRTHALVKFVFLKVSRVVLLNGSRHIGRFHATPTSISAFILKVLFVHLTLNVLTVTAYLVCKGNGYCLAFHKFRYFGY